MEPTASAWPHMALLNQVMGLTNTTMAAIDARLVLAPSSIAM